MQREFEGRAPSVAPGAFVAPNADLIGDVVLAEQASVWFTTVLRADGDRITIGARSNVQDGAVVHADPGRPVTLGGGVTVGHRAVVHGCVIGPDVLIGMGSLILNDALVGTGSIVGAGAVVAEGSVIPPGSLVLGVPGRVVRQVREDEAERIRRNATTYVELAARYLAG